MKPGPLSGTYGSVHASMFARIDETREMQRLVTPDNTYACRVHDRKTTHILVVQWENVQVADISDMSCPLKSIFTRHNIVDGASRVMGNLPKAGNFTAYVLPLAAPCYDGHGDG